MHRLKYLMRKQRGISQDDLSKSLGTGRSTIANWEAGNHEPELSVLVQIVGCFGVTLVQMIKRDLSKEDA